MAKRKKPQAYTPAELEKIGNTLHASCLISESAPRRIAAKQKAEAEAKKTPAPNPYTTGPFTEEDRQRILSMSFHGGRRSGRAHRLAASQPETPETKAPEPENQPAPEYTDADRKAIAATLARSGKKRGAETGLSPQGDVVPSIYNGAEKTTVFDALHQEALGEQSPVRIKAAAKAEEGKTGSR